MNKLLSTMDKFTSKAGHPLYAGHSLLSLTHKLSTHETKLDGQAV